LVIATDATVQSHAYAAACQARGLRALEMACPLLVPLVEEGWTTCGEAATCGGADAACAAKTASLQVAGPPAVAQAAVTAEVIRIYLGELLARAAAEGMKPDALVLGCTHYPLLRPLLEAAVPPGLQVIDSAEATAETAARLFGQQEKPAPNESLAETQLQCFATDSVEKFERLGSRFLGRSVGQVELVDLGG
jgi:glutamate racemase